MEVEKVLHMNGGDGKASYAENSLLQKKAMIMTKPIIKEAIHKMHNSFPTATHLAIADLGCSSGPNTLMAVHEIVTTIHKIRRDHKKQSPINVQIFLNDLPGNDFNSVFRALSSFKKQLKSEIGEGFGGCFVHASPGSFYDRLFESQSLHFVYSSYSLHWLSQVPEEIRRSNKSNICMSNGSSPRVIKAYYKQFQSDFTAFLRCRSEELVTGGCIVLTLLGRSDDPSIRGSGFICDLLGFALNQMLSEGLIKEEALDTFSVPVYMPSPSEIEMEVKNEGSFGINRVQVSELDWAVAAPHTADGDAANAGSMTGMVRAVTEAMLANHFGQGLMDEVFMRCGRVIADCMAKQRTFFTNVTVSLTKNI